MAAAVYLDYSDEALAGFELIADANVHFGGWHGFSLAERLLRSVARDVDPKLQSMPYTVELQELADSVVHAFHDHEPAPGAPR